MKRVIVVAYEKRTGQQYAQTLTRLFSDVADISYYCLCEGYPDHLDADIVLASTYSVCEVVKCYVHNFEHIIIADITLRKDALEQLHTLPPKTKALLVNNSLENAIDTISLIYKYGIHNLDLIPFYPSAQSIPHCDLAITPGETTLVPPDIKHVIDLGDRVLSMRTISEIASRLNTIYKLSQPVCKAYFDSLIPPDASTPEMLGQIQAMEQRLQLVMQIFDSGVISLDNCGIITFINALAAALLDVAGQQLYGSSLEQLFPTLWKGGAPLVIRDQVITIGSAVLIVSIYHLEYNASSQGYLVLIRRFTDLEKEQYKIRRQVMSQGHVAKYTFDNIVGESPAIQQTKQMARKIATSNSTVLIYGQTGTGKELFAQSIHNASNRRSYPFIAINCAAIPENLLESELFGYEEGSFTGAKKGGKPGYFELAHKGTLFLDEISEMDVHLQSRLLRVLQEKEVTRVGGNTIINVDVRIIAASNKNLKILVNQQKFRPDLYYRLNVLNLSIPPLNQRKEDIPLLIEDMKSEMGGQFVLTPEALSMIQGIHFEGNVRELRNLVERLLYCDQQLIDPEMLSRYLDQEPSAQLSDKDSILERFLQDQREKIPFFVHILNALMVTAQTHVGLGRHSIQQVLEASGIFCSEQEVRTALQTLQFYRLVQVLRGRGGTRITALGITALSYLERSTR